LRIVRNKSRRSEHDLERSLPSESSGGTSEAGRKVEPV